VITTVPLKQGNTAVIVAVYPEFRHDIGVQARTRQAWTDYLILIAWTFFPASAILAGVAPVAVAVLFGPGWGLAAAIAPLAAIRAGINAVESALASALEPIGRFRLLVPTAIASVAVIALGAVVAATTKSWVPALLGLITASCVRHLLQVVFTCRDGALDGWSLAKGYLGAVLVATIFGGAAALVSAGMDGRLHPLAAAAGAVILIAAVVASIATRRHLPPVQILARYRADASAAS
jgi:O-antigen/teichoic acid export membrane protein